jgi:hypothetical protein
MNKNKIMFIVIGVVILVGVFYGGMIYGKSKIPTLGANKFDSNMQNGVGQFGPNGRNNKITGGGFVAGQIIGKDANSITVQLMNNDPASINTSSGSKIIFLDGSTTIAKTITGSVNDLATGTQVSVTGTVNSDGSLIAKSIQIRPQIKQNTGTQ